MAKVVIRKNEDVESLIKRFKKKVINEGTLTELKKREYYLSPSQKRKEKSKQAQKRLRKFQAKHPVIERDFY
jgi:small subunit ribosomal protein S21